MSKRPSFQFYPADWRNDQSLRLVSAGARALWIDMLCLMHEGEPYGHLTAKGRPMQPAQLARLIGESPAAVKRWLNELIDNEVCSSTDDGIIFSRRMVRDEQVREARAAGGVAGGEHGVKGAVHGSKGGRPRKPKGASGGEERGDEKPPLKPPPSSSSSASHSSEDKSSEPETGSSGLSPKLDPNAQAWTMAKAVLSDQGGMSTQQAGRAFGKLLRDYGLQAEDLLPPLGQAMVNKTGDPLPYLTAAAQRLKGRTSPAREPQRVGFV